MLDFGTMVMLICATVAALALGVLLAYAFCAGLFRLFNMHARALAAGNAKTKTHPASI